MPQFFSEVYYGNTIGAWALAMGIAVAGFLVGKILYWTISRGVRRFAARTQTQIDDFIVDTVDEPVVVIVTVLGLWIGIRTLNLPSAVTSFLWNAIQAAIVLAVTWMIARLWQGLVLRVLSKFAARTDSELDDQLLPIVRRGGKASIWILGLIVALNNAGYDVAALIAGLGIGGLALAMAAKDTVSNVFGGFTIFTDRPFSIRDRIVINGIDGIVSEIGIRSTRLRKLDGREVTIPNSRFADSAVENISREPSRKIVESIRLAYDTDPAKVREAMDALAQVVDGYKQHLLEDKTSIGFQSFGESSLDLRLIYYIKQGEDISAVTSGINLAILDRLHGIGVSRAVPTSTVYTREDPA